MLLTISHSETGFSCGNRGGSQGLVLSYYHGAELIGDQLPGAPGSGEWWSSDR